MRQVNDRRWVGTFFYQHHYDEHQHHEYWLPPAFSEKNVGHGVFNPIPVRTDALKPIRDILIWNKRCFTLLLFFLFVLFFLFFEPLERRNFTENLDTLVQFAREKINFYSRNSVGFSLLYIRDETKQLLHTNFKLYNIIIFTIFLDNLNLICNNLKFNSFNNFYTYAHRRGCDSRKYSGKYYRSNILQFCLI